MSKLTTKPLSVGMTALVLGGMLTPMAHAEDAAVSSDATTSYAHEASGLVASAAAAATRDPIQLSSQYITVMADPDSTNRTRIAFDFRGVDVQEGDYFDVTHVLADTSIVGKSQNLGTFSTLYPSANSDWLTVKGSTSITATVNGVDTMTTRSSVIDDKGNVIFNITNINGGIRLTATDAFSREVDRVVDAHGYTNVILSKVLDAGWQDATAQLGDISALSAMNTKRYTYSLPTVVKVNDNVVFDAGIASKSLDVAKRMTETVNPVIQETGGTSAVQYAPIGTLGIQNTRVDSFYSNFTVTTSRSKAGDEGTRQTVTSSIDPAWSQYFTFECGDSLPLAGDVISSSTRIAPRGVNVNSVGIDEVITACSPTSITIEYTAGVTDSVAQFSFKPETFFAHATLDAAKNNITNQVKFITTTSHESAADTVRTESRFDYIWLDAAAFTTYPPLAIRDESTVTFKQTVTKDLIGNDLFPGGEFSSIRFTGPMVPYFSNPEDYAKDFEADISVDPNGVASIKVTNWDVFMGTRFKIPYEITDANGHISTSFWVVQIDPSIISLTTVDDNIRVRAGESETIAWLNNDIIANLANFGGSYERGEIMTRGLLDYDVLENSDEIIIQGLLGNNVLSGLPDGYIALPMSNMGTVLNPNGNLTYTNVFGVICVIFSPDFDMENMTDDSAKVFAELEVYINDLISKMHSGQEVVTTDLAELNKIFDKIPAYQGLIATAPVSQNTTEMYAGYTQDSPFYVFASETIDQEIRNASIVLSSPIEPNPMTGYRHDGSVDIKTKVFINFYDLSATLDSSIEADDVIANPKTVDEASSVIGFNSRTVHHTYTNTGDEPWTGLYIENVATGERTPVNRDVAPGESFDVTSASGTLTEGLNELHYRLVTNDDKVVAEDTVWINAVAPAVITTEPDTIKLRAGTDGELDVLANDSSTKEIDPSTLTLVGDDSWTVTGNTATKDGVIVTVVDGKLKVTGDKEGSYTGLSYTVKDKDGTVSEATPITITVFDYHVGLEATVGTGDDQVDADTFDDAYEVTIKDAKQTSVTLDTVVRIPNPGDEPITVTKVKYVVTDANGNVVDEGYLDESQVAGVINASEERAITGTQDFPVGDWMVTYEVETEEGVTAANPIAVKVTAEVVPNDAPSHSVPEAPIPSVEPSEPAPSEEPTVEPSEEPSETPVVNEDKPSAPIVKVVEDKPTSIDPNTGGSASAQMAKDQSSPAGLLGLMSLAGAAILTTLGLKRRKQA